MPLILASPAPILIIGELMHLVTPRLFHRRNRIVLTAGITVAVIAAMAGPAGARTMAGAQASTPAPVDITGNLTWTYDYTPLYGTGVATTGADKQSGTFDIHLTNVVNGGSAAGGDSSTYSFTDNTNISYTGTGSNCTSTYTGSFTGSGSLLYPQTAQNPGVFVAFDPSLTSIAVTIAIPYTETQTLTDTGPPPCPSTGTTTVSNSAIPACLDSMGNSLGLGGSLNGTYPNATVNLGCSGTYASPTQTGSYSVTGTLTITPSCGSGTAASSCLHHEPAGQQHRRAHRRNLR